MTVSLPSGGSGRGAVGGLMQTASSTSSSVCRKFGGSLVLFPPWLGPALPGYEVHSEGPRPALCVCRVSPADVPVSLAAFTLHWWTREPVRVSPD
ncbi:hypothetical protein E2C01_084533 [Portunus trituberculatus]|uniref:Uncharacterized protein n=1 Tax=Portunus trituberculatus TaxID=210409 RepID=A0A5B7J4G1_PORTR|nr:hypothetical protein [Portunus trituberculatus]